MIRVNKKLVFLFLILLSKQPFSLFAINWDWSSIRIDDIILPELCGTAIAEYQNSGSINCPDSNWAAWEHKEKHNEKYTINNNDKSGSACNFYKKYEKTIKLLQELGCNSFRFSVDWSVIEPQENVINESALQHYVNLCDKLIQANIIPMVTLHHFVHPEWFEKKGGFEKEDNINYFITFCKLVFKKLHNKVHLWCTINEPNAFVFQSYINGVFPPGKSSLLTAAIVMKNMLIAHVKIYKALKKMDAGHDAQIGLVHQYLPFESHSYVSVLEYITCTFMNYVFNDAIIHFLKTGELFAWIPFLRTIIPSALYCNDFIGLNFYSHVVLESHVMRKLCSFDFNLKALITPSCFQGEIMTDMKYPVCPESFYDAILEISKLKKPIYITENGVPDSRDDIRQLYIKRYLYALSSAIRDGCDIRGYYYWSLMDNFEWNEGWSKKFGLYSIDAQTQNYTLRPGAFYYKHALHNAQRHIYNKDANIKNISD